MKPTTKRPKTDTARCPACYGEGFRLSRHGFYSKCKPCNGTGRIGGPFFRKLLNAQRLARLALRGAS